MNINFKIFLTLLFSLSISVNAIAQKEILFENVDDYNVFEKQAYGPNGKHFLYNYVSLDFATPSVYEDQFKIKYGASYGFSYGLRYKYKVLKWFSVGSGLNYSFQNYVFDDVFLHKLYDNQTDRLTLNNIGSELFFRFNIGKTGNSMGKYIDLGALGYLNYCSSYFIKTQKEEFLGIESQKTTTKYKCVNTNNLINYGAFFRIGTGHFAFYAKYIFSDQLKQQIQNDFTSNLDLPKFSVGIELGIF